MTADPKYHEVIELLARRSGMEISKLGTEEVIKKIRNFMGLSGLNSEEELLKIINLDLQNKVFDDLISNLTIGETFFFRYASQFEFLKNEYFSEMNKRGVKTLRAWSAACSTGEEAYSIAIAASSVFGKNALIEIMGSDINRNFLDIAKGGVYNNWSARGESIPLWAKDYILKEGNKRFLVADEIKKLVTFNFLNLVTDYFTFSNLNLSNLDLILCRNVLLYLEPEVARNVVKKLTKALKEGGLLFVAPVEFSYPIFDELEPCITRDQVSYYKKKKTEASRSPDMPPGELAENKAKNAAPDPEFLIADIMYLANKGRYTEAMSLIDSFPERLEKDYFLNYYKALILQNMSKKDEALKFLKRSIYLNTNFVMAHFQLSLLYKELNELADMKRHFKIISWLIKSKDPLDEIEQSGGFTVGRMNDFIQKMIGEAGNEK